MEGAAGEAALCPGGGGAGGGGVWCVCAAGFALVTAVGVSCCVSVILMKAVCGYEKKGRRVKTESEGRDSHTGSVWTQKD